MTDSTNQTATIGFMNNSAQECQAMLSKLRSKCRAKNSNCFKAFDFAVNKKAHGLEPGPFNVANTEVYDILITNIKNETLLATLGGLGLCSARRRR